jgi:hypothetical protein
MNSARSRFADRRFSLDQLFLFKNIKYHNFEKKEEDEFGILRKPMFTFPVKMYNAKIGIKNFILQGSRIV